MVRFIPFFVAAAYLASSTEAFAPTASQVRTQRLTFTENNHVQRIASPYPITTASTSALADMLTQTELPEKIYLPEDKETAKVLGGLKIGTRKLTVITGASSGLGLNCAVALAKTGRHFIVMACRDVEKGKKVAKEMNMPDDSYVVMKLELGSLQSVRDFVFNLKAFKSARPVNNLICNAAVYKPTDPEPAWTDDGFEQSMGINHFGHFLLANLLVDDMAKSKDARLCIVGSITGNTNTVGKYTHLIVVVECTARRFQSNTHF
jgi:protochlorophyllide reductase